MSEDLRAPTPDLRLVTWNVWKRGGDWRRRGEAIARILEDLRPDVVTLQQSWRSYSADQGEDLATRLGLPHRHWWPNAAPPEAQPEDHRVGMALLSRWPLSDPTWRPLPTEAAKARGGRSVAGAIVEHPRCRLPVVTTHLSSDPTGSAERCLEVVAVGKLADQLRRSAAGTGPVVTGDLNAEPDSDEVRRLGGLLTAPAVPGLALVDAWRYAVQAPLGNGASWRQANDYLPWGTVDQRIDYVLVGDGLLPIRVGVAGDGPVPIEDTPAAWASTHCAVWADLCIR